MATMLRYIIGIAVTTLVVAGIWQGTIHLEGKKPEITTSDDIRHVGPNSTLSISFKDEGRGLRQVVAYLEQEGIRQPLGGMNFHAPGAMERTLRLTFDQPDLVLKEGPATLIFSAIDYSLRKNAKDLTINVMVDLTPPRIATMTSAHYINPGGSCLVVYRVSEGVDRTGVLVNETFYPGYPFENGEGQSSFAVLFGIPVNATGNNMRIGITARDQAGNEAFTTFPHHIRTKTFRDRTLAVSDRFLENTMPEFRNVIPALRQASLVDTFIYVNETLRQQNDQEIQSICSRSEPRKLWEGRFLRMTNAATMAGFGDRRTYTYNGQPITSSLHDGIDLASVINAVVEASNSGIVVYAEYLGIYGNTIIIDHGLGLFSFYAHLSSIDVKVDEMTARGQPVGRSGMTGLAGGDHLHFGIFLGKQFVNPVEWWDQGWINDNILKKAHLP